MKPIRGNRKPNPGNNLSEMVSTLPPMIKIYRKIAAKMAAKVIAIHFGFTDILFSK
jgi:hypothetical protein